MMIPKWTQTYFTQKRIEGIFKLVREGAALCTRPVLSVALYPLRLAFRLSMVHKIILDALFPISIPHAEFLQDCTIIREDRLTAQY